ncbi:hypothetical protein AVEN_246299-1 [Araneus ventricosus]|uniref:Uncharacterized protein n=1 Tax=Araneus ventricosus TaxID=182803 RepID=A0A4Y2HV16_ARAVE|nr:hypothetical protein AVEN_246299-1 [Araneus ventricosus]
MAGVEEVTGDHGGNYWKQLMFYYNNKYLKKWLQCKSTESNLTRVYTKMMLEDHFAHLYGPAAAIEDHKPLLLNKVSVEEEDDILEVLPPVTEEEDEPVDQEEGLISQARRPSAKFDLQDPEEGRPLKSKKKRNSESSAVPKKPPLLKRQTTLAMFAPKPAEDDATKLLQKALLHNPYNKLHHKYNPNLVDDEAQDLAMQLRKRRLRTRRLTLLAMHANEGSGGTPERRLSDEAVLANPMVCTAASFFLERAQRRRAVSKLSTGGESSPRSIRLERQSAVATSSNGAISITEEEEPTVVITKPSSEVKVETRRSTESQV